MVKPAPKGQACVGSVDTFRVIRRNDPLRSLSPDPQIPWDDAGSLLPKQSGGLAWKVSKDNNQEREGTKTGDNPREI